MKKMFSYMKQYRRECVLAPLFKLLEASFELLVPLVMAAIIDTGIANGGRSYILRMGLVLVALGLVGLIASITAQYFAARAAVGFSAALRSAAFSHVQRLSRAQRDKLGVSTLITRLTSDINQVQNGVNLTLRLFLRSPFIVFGAMIMAFTVDARAALVFAAAIPLLSLVVFGVMLITMPMYKRVQSSLDRVLGATRENLTGVRVIRAFTREEAEVERFDAENAALTHKQLTVGRISSLMNPVTYVLLNLALIALIYAGGLRVSAGYITQGAVVALVNYLSQVLVELIKLANLIINMTKAWASLGRVRDILEIDPGMTSGTLTNADAAAPAVAFENVSMRYGGASGEALEDITLTAMPGETIGIIGSTGSGKSTLVNLIPRFYDVESGSVRVLGTDVRAWDLAALRAHIGIAPQKAALFQGTIRENLLWGNETASEDDLRAALKSAQALDFVLSRPEGLDAEIEPGGHNLSGGQRQRLTIARALVRRPEILILDDSASALDLATDARLRAAIAHLDYHPTVFIVSQRAASLMHADKILVLDDGRTEALGAHAELLKTSRVYREIYSTQFPKGA